MTRLTYLPLISFSSSFPLSPPRALLGLVLFASHHHSSIGGLTESIQGSVGKGLAGFGRGRITFGLLAAVGLVVEVAEEDDEGDGIADKGVVHPVGEVTVDIEGQCSVANGHMELNLRQKVRTKACLINKPLRCHQEVFRE